MRRIAEYFRWSQERQSTAPERRRANYVRSTRGTARSHRGMSGVTDKRMFATREAGAVEVWPLEATGMTMFSWLVAMMQRSEVGRSQKPFSAKVENLDLKLWPSIQCRVVGWTWYGSFAPL